MRSHREFRRWVQFGKNSDDLLFKWLTNIKNCTVFWDIGSANGLEGFYVNHIHDAKVVFLEPFTPSIETILKTIYHQTSLYPQKKGKFEVIQALINKESGISKMDMHEQPIPGSIRNSCSAGKKSYAYGGREQEKTSVSQWLASTCLDDLWLVQKLPQPTHIKIDVDGFELEALKGGEKLLNSGVVKEWCIEVSEHCRSEVLQIMSNYGYNESSRGIHYPHLGEKSPADILFIKIVTKGQT